MPESEYGRRIRDMEQRLTVIEERDKQTARFIAELREEAKAVRSTALTTRGAAIATLVGVIVVLIEQIVAHAAGLKGP